MVSPPRVLRVWRLFWENALHMSIPRCLGVGVLRARGTRRMLIKYGSREFLPPPWIVPLCFVVAWATSLVHRCPRVIEGIGPPDSWNSPSLLWSRGGLTLVDIRRRLVMPLPQVLSFPYSLVIWRCHKWCREWIVYSDFQESCISKLFCRCTQSSPWFWA